MNSETNALTLASALSLTITDPMQWENALDVLCRTCGATKALITRRSLQGATIVVPTRVQDEWQSPLIHGFSLEQVEDFLMNYQESDPWTPIEAQNPPYTPYALSRFFPVDKLRRTKFWDWLEPQGIVDSIVAEIGHDADGWTALNLYLNEEQARNADAVVAALKEILPQLSTIWSAGKEVFMARSDPRPVPSIVELMSDPCLVVDLDFRLVAGNAAAQELIDRRIITGRTGETVALPRDWERYLGPRTSRLATLPNPPEVLDWRPSVAEDLRMEHVSGEMVGHHIILLLSTASHDGDRADWDHPGLNEREKILVRHLAHGGRVKDGAGFFGISVRANADIWKSASQKLGGLKKQDLPLRNQKFLEREET